MPANWGIFSPNLASFIFEAFPNWIQKPCLKETSFGHVNDFIVTTHCVLLIMAWLGTCNYILYSLKHVCMRMHKYVCMRMHKYVCMRMHKYVCMKVTNIWLRSNLWIVFIDYIVGTNFGILGLFIGLNIDKNSICCDLSQNGTKIYKFRFWKYNFYSDIKLHWISRYKNVWI